MLISLLSLAARTRNAVGAVTFLGLICCSGLGTSRLAPVDSVNFRQLYALRDGERVFAYSRVDPTGKKLVYTSEVVVATHRARNIVVVDTEMGAAEFVAPGMDGYFSVDGTRMIFLSEIGSDSSVAILDMSSGRIANNVAPLGIGDYFSWGRKAGRDVILTIAGNYYVLSGDSAKMPYRSVQPCPGIGPPIRPLISKDAKRITTFVDGAVVVRNIETCDDIIRTGLVGAKADFSYDGSYIAMHSPRPGAANTDILVLDLRRKTFRNITAHLAGSSYFPSWTRDGALVFRYEGEDFHGFVMARNVLAAKPMSFPAVSAIGERVRGRSWSQVFQVPPIDSAVNLVVVWGPLGAHTNDALRHAGAAERYFASCGWSASISMAADPAMPDSDVEAAQTAAGVSLRRLVLTRLSTEITELYNQNPVVLAFSGNEVVNRRMGAQSADSLQQWARDLLPNEAKINARC